MHGWALDPGVTQLNHGSFGAVLVDVLEEQRRWQELFEANPTYFVNELYQPAVDAAREATAAFVGSDPADLAFVRNATTGVNDVLLSLEPSLGPGDEIVVPDHTYNACRNAVDVAALRTGATVVVAPLPFPVEAPGQVTDAVLDKVGPRTRLVLIDWISSASAILFPVADIVSQLEPDVPVLIDAAHAPGQVSMSLDALGASFVAGNAHKWMCSPKGAAILHVRRDHHDIIRPGTVSHGWNTPLGGRSRFHHLFDYTGTDDNSAWLTLPYVISTMAGLHPGGWDGVMAVNHDLAVAGRSIVADRIGAGRPVPDAMLGAMAVIPLPVEPVPDVHPHPLSGVLRRKWSVEVPVWTTPDGTVQLRISAQLYNTLDDYEALAAALAAEIA